MLQSRERGDNSPITWRKWRDGLELASQALLRCPALSAAAGPPCQSPTAAPSPPRCIRHRRRFGGDARHAPRASVSPTAITKNSATANAVALFLAGAEGLEPSARGFGVDVRTNHRERGRGGATRFPPQAAERAVLVWCCEKIFRAKAEVKLLLLEDLLPRGRTHITRRGPNRCRWLGHGFPLNPKRLCR